MIQLSLNETRVLGVLFEKERTTPDQYPLSLNALTVASNQKTNRDPVLNLSEVDVQRAVDTLLQKGLMMEESFGGRVRKYRQRFGNTEFSDFKLSRKEQALLCVLFLRGAQTPGELRTRTNRLCDFQSVEDVEQTLQALIDERSDPLVQKLAREPGQREARYVHLFSGAPTGAPVAKPAQTEIADTSSPDDLAVRVQRLEEQVENLADEIVALKKALAVLTAASMSKA